MFLSRKPQIGRMSNKKLKFIKMMIYLIERDSYKDNADESCRRSDESRFR